METTEIFSELLKQITFYAIVSSIVTDGIKKTIKTIKKMKEEDKLPGWLGVLMVYAFGFLACFFLQSELIVNIWARLFFGFIIGSIGVSAYNAVIKAFLGLFPNIVKKIFSK